MILYKILENTQSFELRRENNSPFTRQETMLAYRNSECQKLITEVKLLQQREPFSVAHLNRVIVKETNGF
jgi:predicted transcriptional regulator